MADSGPLLVPPNGGKPLWTMGMLMDVIASAGQTGGACAAMEVLFPPDVGPPLHVHHNESEINYVLEGSMRFRCGDEEMTAGPGGFVFMPSGLSHAFKSGPDGARMFAVVLPGGLEGLYEAVGEAAASRTVPSLEPNIAGWLEHAGRFGLEIVGPPLA